MLYKNGYYVLRKGRCMKKRGKIKKWPSVYRHMLLENGIISIRRLAKECTTIAVLTLPFFLSLHLPAVIG